MPAKPKWFRRIPEIKAVVEEDFPAPLLDRELLSELFGVGKRSAHALMHRIGARRLGGAYVVSREDLRRWLTAMEQTPQVEREILRASRVREVLDQARKHLAARQIAIPVDREAMRGRLAEMPSSIRLAPGELRIEFRGAEDLLCQLFELSQAVMNDYAKFEELTGRPDRTL